MRTLLLVGLTLAGCGSDEVEEVGRFMVTLVNVSEPGDLSTSAGGTDVVLAPGVYAVSPFGAGLFEEGEQASVGLERLAEDGDNEPLFEEVRASGLSESGIFGSDNATTYSDAPTHPGDSVRFFIEARTGQRLHLATMFAQSNDVYLASPPAGLDPFALSELDDAAGMLRLYDAGTEVNQEPGVGADQAPRQASADAGEPEGGVITMIREGLPEIPSFVSLTVVRTPSE